MKKTISLIAIIIATILIAGCNDHSKTIKISSLPGLHYSGTDTTTIDSCQSFVLENFSGKNSCGKFFKSTHWVPGSSYHVVKHTVTKQGPKVSDEELDKLVNPNYSVESSNSSWFKEGLEGLIFSTLLILFILLVLLSILRKMGLLLTKRERNDTDNIKTDKHDLKESVLNPIKEEISELTSLASVIASAGGGSAKSGKDGISVEIKGIQPSLVTVNNHGKNYSCDISISDDAKKKYNLGNVVFKTDYKKKDAEEKDTENKDKK